MAREVDVEVITADGRVGSGSQSRNSPIEIRPGCGVLLGMVLIAWGVEAADVIFNLFGFPLDSFGIWPRTLHGLPGVLLSPWLHGSWEHLSSNTVAFLMLGFLMSLAEGNRFLRTTLLLVIISGLGTWLIGRGSSVHVGASGVIYGYFGYLLARAWTERRPLWVVTGLAVLIVYGGMLQGVLPSDGVISWEAHLCGFLGGLWLGRSRGRSQSSRY